MVFQLFKKKINRKESIPSVIRAAVSLLVLLETFSRNGLIAQIDNVSYRGMMRNGYSACSIEQLFDCQ